VTTWIWVGLAVFCVAVLAGAIWAGYQAARTWQYVRGLPRLIEEISRLNRNVADVQRRVVRVESQVADLQRQVDGLSVSLARAKVLAGAAGEVRETVNSVRAFVPFR
jgi:hypothetical protein